MADNDKIKRLAERLTGPDTVAGEAAQEEVNALTEAERGELTDLLTQHAAHGTELHEDQPAEVIDHRSEDDRGSRSAPADG